MSSHSDSEGIIRHNCMCQTSNKAKIRFFTNLMINEKKVILDEYKDRSKNVNVTHPTCLPMDLGKLLIFIGRGFITVNKMNTKHGFPPKIDVSVNKLIQSFMSISP